MQASESEAAASAARSVLRRTAAESPSCLAAMMTRGFDLGTEEGGICKRKDELEEAVKKVHH